MNIKRLLWVTSCCLANRNMWVGKASRSSSKNLFKHLVFHHYFVDLNTKRLFWT